MKKIISLCILFIMAGISSAAFSYDVDLGKAQNLAKYTAYIPQGQKMQVVLADEVNSNNAIVGQAVKAYFLESFKYNSTTIAPATSAVLGTVVKNKKSSETEPSELLIRFTSIRTPYNNTIPISAVVLTADKTGLMKGTNQNKDIVIQADSKIEILFDQPITIVAQ